MRKLLLINPMGRRSGFLLSRMSTFPPLGLAYVAAVTPPHWEVTLVDENFDEVTYEDADLVGITAFTSNIARAYEIAQRYRDNKVKVVIGGIHASALPDEALNFVDSVVIGEVEGIWGQVIDDFEKNRLQPRYVGPRIDLSKSTVVPRRDLISANYFWSSVQTSRGCPFNCHFCSVTRYLGFQYRQREADEVLKELETIEGPYVTFVDDNLIGYSAQSKRRAAAIFQGMIDRKMQKKWWMQTSINAADDEKILELAAQAGCMYALIGFEAISVEALKDMKKGINIKAGVQNYKKVIDTFHKYGIAVWGAFILGNDNESADYYKVLRDFVVDAGVDIVQINILTPLPGTELMEQMVADDRLIYADYPKDWEKYRMSYIVHKMVGTDEDTVYKGNNFVKEQIYTFPTYHQRLLRSALSLGKVSTVYATYKMNEAFKKGWLNAHYRQKIAAANSVPPGS